MQGTLLIDKPAGWTSFDVVNKVRRMAETSGFNTTGRKRFPVGHTGTLDPLATGLLVLLLGKATRDAMMLTKLDKTYEVTMKLGETSTTGDDEGEKTHASDVRPAREELEAALQKFVGDSMQTPPAFSAIKINGQRAYKLAREGKAPELTARPIHIEAIKLASYEYPFVKFTADVSSGTYIRSLVEDLGKMLGTGAYMSALRRTRVGTFDIANALSMEDLTPESLGRSVVVAPIS
ncbi:MAG TPA: tRNA pseudouridine(55) synthase TruB [Candidatus Saccharimonadales bacterium]